MSRSAALALGVLTVVGLVAYAVIAHLLTVSDDRSLLGYAFALASMWLLAVAATWGSRWRWAGVLGATLLATAAWRLHTQISWDPRWIYLIQHAGTNLWLGVWFGLTLRAGREPIITRLARIVHGTLPPRIVVYTRQVTVAWTVYFVLMTAASLVLFFAGWSWWWSVLANFVTTPCVLMMFVVEYIVRRRLHPDFHHASFVESFRAFGRKS